jgi:5-hydroxyisourate hydrolase-like protein (transthyretin family)
VTIETFSQGATRGESVHLKGAVIAEGEPCSGVRVDVILAANGKTAVIGSVATDEAGRFDRSLVLPLSIPLGDYEVRARTSGDTRCGPGESQ